MKKFIYFLKLYVSKLSIKNLLLFCLSIYRCFFSLHFGGACRFYPSCSHYAEKLIVCYPLGRALFLIIRRLSKCHFFGREYGLDLVPDQKLKNKKASGS